MDGPLTRALAEQLNEALTGKPVAEIRVPQHRWQANMLLLNCVGHVMQRVRSHGKWLFFDFSHGYTWVCHLITRSKWQIVAAGAEVPSKRKPLIAVVLRNGTMAVLTGHPIFYILPTEKVNQHPEIKALGPDPLATATFHDDFPYRLRQHPNRTLAANLLEQDIVAGLGNALKCEILFATRCAPNLRVADMLASQIDHLAGTIVGMAATAFTFATRGEVFPYRVYDRAGMPCTICADEITVDRSGQDGHLTWYCPTCQPLGKTPTLFG